MAKIKTVKSRSIRCNHHVATFTKAAALCKDYPEYSLSLDPLALPWGKYTFKYDYPLSTAAKFEHTLSPNTTATDILRHGKEDYKRIYADEDKSTKVKPGNIPGMLNRNSTDGKYGIWGHGIDDLYFEGVKIDAVRKTVNFSIGS